MFPGLGGMNPKKMQGMLKQLGMQQEDIPASEVIIKKEDNSIIRIENPSIQKIKFQGQESFQITGEVKEEAGEIFSQDDVKLVAEKTSKSEEQARKALEQTNGDIAEAIMALSE